MLPWSIDTSFLFAALIVAGYELRKYFLHCKWSVVIFALISWLVLYWSFAGSNISVGIYGGYEALSIIPFALIALLETYSFCGILQKIEKTLVTKALAYIGRHSLRLMCIHLVIYYRTLGSLTAIGVSSDNKYTMLTCVFVVILLVDAFIEFAITKAMDKMPLARYI